MHDSEDLMLLLKSLRKEARENGFELAIEPSLDKNLYLIANPQTKKVAAVGLTEINGTYIIASYSINLNRHDYYKAEGFKTSEMTNDPCIKNDIFEFVPADELINFLKN